VKDCPHWLPKLMCLADYGGVWADYEDAVYEAFCSDVVTHTIVFEDRRVAVRVHPSFRGKEHGFWHCVQEGAVESDRTPDISRCERIRWIRSIIEHATDSSIDQWENWRGSEHNRLFWFAEEYLVVLADRGRYWLLKTAYCTTEEYRKRKLRTEKELFQKSQRRPSKKNGV
jgi:hypothetical protein